ncbi:F-box only protein 33 isoform X2 [Dendroctonus ponderosae]|nr:F-box only protein 33 isoform X2 [Dendroctonus ponderosae]
MENHGECSKPKKSKCCSSWGPTGARWADLPTVVLQQIFQYLSPEDRKNASCVCRHWREIYFHPKWWKAVTFRINHDNITKSKFLASTFASIVSKATISLECLTPQCIDEFIDLLRLLHKNNLLRSLVIEPSHCRLDDSVDSLICAGGERRIIEIRNLILDVLPKLREFSLGGLEDLAYFSDSFLRNASPSKITLLGLASIRDNLAINQMNYFTPDLMSSFKKLQILSVDYDQLSNTFLHNLKELNDLQRLIVHVHAIPTNHSETSNEAWKNFKVAHPKCLLRLTVVHAYMDIRKLHLQVLKENMPLSHIKVFFCEYVNLELLHILSRFYKNTLRSVMWIDSLSNVPGSWKFLRPSHNPDPLVLITWLCTQFEELVLYGYKYPEENLVAIGRLKGSRMKKLEIPKNDIVTESIRYRANPIKEVEKNLKGAWKPIYSGDLHPVIIDPTLGDSDEFLLPYILADLH